MATSETGAGSIVLTAAEDEELAGIVGEANRRLHELAWPARVEADALATDAVCVRYEGREGPAAGGSFSLHVGIAERDESVALILAAIRRRGWDASELSRYRIARSTIWCEPP